MLDILDEQPVTKDITGCEEVEFNGAATENVTFSYGEETIISDVSIPVLKASIIGISGRSGSGKSTIAKLDATDEEILEAAKRSHSLGFIRRLTDGLDTMLHEDSLSQGQRQLLCITRVMLCLPSMLILDEATSSIDTRTEVQIQEAFDRLMQGRTSFIVAHRLSTIRSADLILVMKDGKVIEQGTHDALMQWLKEDAAKQSA